MGISTCSWNLKRPSCLATSYVSAGIVSSPAPLQRCFHCHLEVAVARLISRNVRAFLYQRKHTTSTRNSECASGVHMFCCSSLVSFSRVHFQFELRSADTCLPYRQCTFRRRVQTSVQR